MSLPPDVTSNKNGKKQQDLFPEILTFQEADLEANTLFPKTPKSTYRSSNFDPPFVFPFNPDILADGNIYSTYDEMRDDDQVKAVLSFKKDLVVAPGWSIQCEDKDIADFVDKNLRSGLVTSIEDVLRDMLSHFEYGFSMTEPIFQNIGGKILLKDLKTRPPHSFKFHLDERGDVESISQLAVIKENFFTPGYFIHHVYQSDFGNPYGLSDLRAAYQAWKTKKFFLRFWAIYVERFAQPTVVGTYNAGEYDTAKITRFMNMLKTIQNSTYIVIPEGTSIDFKEASMGNGDIYEKGINLLNTMIARSVLVPDLMGLSGERSTGGSFALGQTQFELFMATIKKEQESLARKFNMRIVQPLVRANFGDIPCEFVFNPFKRDDSTEFMKIWIEAAKSKLWKPSDEEINHLREMTNFPISDDIERVEEPKPEVPPLPGKEKGPAIDPRGTIEESNDSQLISMELIRETTRFESKVDFKEVQDVLNVSDQRLSRNLTSSAKDIYTDYIDQIQKRNLINKFKPDAINDLKPRFQKPMNLQFKREFQDLFKKSFNQAQKEIFPSVDKQFKESVELAPEEFLEVIEAESFKLVGDYSSHVTGKMRNKLVEGIKNGVGERELVKILKETGSTETTRWLRTVVRTKNTEMFNRGRKSFYDNDPFAKQIIEAFEFSAIMDGRTSDVCSFLDGKIFEKGELTNNIVPPLHFNCRSILVPVTKFEDFKDEKGFTPPSKEPSMDKLKKLGGNLILISDQEIKEFRQADTISNDVLMSGNAVAVPAPGPGKSIVLLSYFISNMSMRNFGEIGLRSTDSDTVHFKQLLLQGKVSDKTFMLKKERWVLDSNQALLIHNPSGLDLSYTIKFKVILSEGT